MPRNDHLRSHTASTACDLNNNNTNAGATQYATSIQITSDAFQKTQDCESTPSYSQNDREKGSNQINTILSWIMITLQGLIREIPVFGKINIPAYNISLNISTTRFFFDGSTSFVQNVYEHFEESKRKDQPKMARQLCKLLDDGLSTGFQAALNLLRYNLFVLSQIVLTSARYFARLCSVYYQNIRDRVYFASELNRLASYVTWMHDVKPSALSMSAAGFYCTASHRDEVSCFSCGLTLSSWSRGMVPISLHAQLSRGHCKYINDPIASENIPTGSLSAPGHRNNAIMSSQSAADGSHSSPVEPAGTILTRTPPLLQSIKPSHLSKNDQHQNQYEAYLANLPEGIRRTIAKAASAFDLSNATSADANELQEDLVRSEAFRLRTFNNVWQYSTIVHPTDLARNGFFYAGVADRVQCAFCKGVLQNWERGDKPDVLHAQHFTYCRLVQGHDVGNQPIFLSALTTNELTNTRDSTNITDELGIVLLSPKYPDFAIEARRLRTFQTCPSNFAISHESLAKAGFFYAGVDDEVICFFCGVRARDWRRQSDAWIEHAAKFPSCQYVIQAKGSEFVTRHTTVRGNAETASGTVNFAVDPRELRARMDSPMVRCVLDMNYPAELIKEVLQKRLATVGRDFGTSEDLLAEIFLYHDEKQTSTRHDPSRAEATVPVLPSVVRGPDAGAASSEKSSSTVAAAFVALGSEGEYAAHAQQLPTGAESPKNRLKQQLSPKEENRQLKTQLTCKICMEEEVAIIFLPCGHLVACAICSPALEKCPMCRVEIRGTARLHFSA